MAATCSRNINWSTDLWRFRMVPTSTFYDTDPSQPQWKHFFHCRAASSRSRTWRLQTSSGPWQSLHQMINQNIVFNCQNNVKSSISLRKSYANQLQLKGSVWIMYVYINIQFEKYINLKMLSSTYQCPSFYEVSKSAPALANHPFALHSGSAWREDRCQEAPPGFSDLDESWIWWSGLPSGYD